MVVREERKGGMAGSCGKVTNEVVRKEENGGDREGSG